jgi:predicted RNA binding protein YcfA (HicA-like mRNA interferase family)
MALTVKLRDVLAFLLEDGWTYKNTEGDHHHYVHPVKTGKLTLVGDRGDDITTGLLNSVLRQAGLTQKELRSWLNR